MRIFIRTFLLFTLLPLLLVMLCNWLVDPLALRAAPGREHLNRNKTELRDQERVFKPFAVLRSQPAAVILGSSRSNHALDPGHAAFASTRAYNLSISGTNMEETRRFFEHAVASAPVQAAIVELDLGFFASSTAAQREAAAYLATPGSANRLGRLQQQLLRAISLTTLRQSLATLQHQDQPAEYTADGRQTDRVFEQRIAGYGGVRNTFEGYMARLAGAEHAQAGDWRRSGRSGRQLPGMADLESMIELTQRRGIRLQLYISPIHAMDAAAQQAIYGWQNIEQWKRALVAIAGRADIPLWDFSGCNSVTSEAIPERGAGSARMENYWDQSHYRLRVGNWILQRMATLDTDRVPADFGVQLDAATLDAHLATIRSDCGRYLQNHAAEAEFIGRLAAVPHRS